MSPTPGDLARYSRQILYAPFGPDGQAALSRSRVTLIGCGALGTVLASTLVRAGVGALRIVDRDFVELDNLQRQVLFDEDDVAANLPKAEAAAGKLRRVNSQVTIEPVVADAHASNIESYCRDADLILDGTDNFETRFLINDVAVKHAKPWVYGACIGGEGLVLPVLPGRGPCLRCIWEEAPPPGMSPTCDTAGVLGPVVNIVASLQALEAMKLLAGRTEALVRKLVTLDAWGGRVRHLDLQASFEAGDCRCCKQRNFDYLDGAAGGATTALCGRNAVQVLPSQPGAVELEELARRLAPLQPARNAYLLRFTAGPLEITVFRDGRAIVKGTTDLAAARSAYAKYIGA